MKTVVFASALALGAIVLGVIALVIFAPRQITIVSISRVKAPQNLVRDNIRFLNRYATWSPFVETDPQQSTASKALMVKSA